MNPIDKVHSSWHSLLRYLNQEPLLSLNNDILLNCHYYPEVQNIFRVFQMPLDQIKVVIIDQEPHYSPNYATGLAFAVSKNVKTTPSLVSIQKEILNTIDNGTDYLGGKLGNWKTLEHWEEQGVFLLNTALTVEAGMQGSHLKHWQEFTKQVVKYIAINQPTIWMLWGKYTQALTTQMIPKSKFNVIGYNRQLIENIPMNPEYNYILKAEHPLIEYFVKDGGFYGCDHFYLANRILEKSGKKSINW
jgi:uracil-DNA glycosylase